MTTEALDFYAYWNGAQVGDLWTTLALITGTDDYRSLLLCVALFGLICAAAGAAVRYRGGDLIVWIAAMVFIFSAAFVPRVNIAVRDVRSANVQVVQNIPLGIGWPASVISRASYWLTESFETAFGDVDAARYTRFGVAFPQRVVTTMLSVKPITADGKMSLTNFTERCIVPEILENSVKRQELLNAPDINALISTNGWVNPARRVFMNNKVLTCTEAAEELKKTLEKTEIPALESRLRLKLNVDFKDGVNAALSTAIPQAESLMLGVSRTMAESLRQSLMMSAIPDTTMTFAAKAGQAPLSAGVAIARSQGNLASEINYRTLSEMARSALPKLRNILEFTVIGLWPMVFLMMLGTGAGGAMVCRAYFTLLISVSLWAPITAIINYLTLHLDMEPMNQLVNSRRRRDPCGRHHDSRRRRHLSGNGGLAPVARPRARLRRREGQRHGPHRHDLLRSCPRILGSSGSGLPACHGQCVRRQRIPQQRISQQRVRQQDRHFEQLGGSEHAQGRTRSRYGGLRPFRGTNDCHERPEVRPWRLVRHAEHAHDSGCEHLWHLVGCDQCKFACNEFWGSVCFGQRRDQQRQSRRRLERHQKLRYFVRDE